MQVFTLMSMPLKFSSHCFLATDVLIHEYFTGRTHDDVVMLTTEVTPPLRWSSRFEAL